ncbi:hypothetical protein BH11BAC1_BH11BAC1_03850 [soil metagenome]
MNYISRRRISLLSLLITFTTALHAQRGDMQYFRYYDQRGINVFENSKTDTVEFDGFKLRLGANFTQGFQSLKHSNTSGVKLYDLAAGFPLAQANLNIDVQLADGVRLNLVSYMSAHHHNETWVKGGYVQVDKVGFLKSDVMNRLWQNLTLKVGHMEINYGDAHFRRSDGGNTFWNPFMENNIMDAFTTEIGGELYWHKKNVLVMFGMTNGEIQGSVTKASDRSPSVYGKVGYDHSFGERNRIRLTGSFLSKSSSVSGTLYGGDRTGSNYQFVMEPSSATLTANAFSGRMNPNFKDNVMAFMFNPFLKLGGLELFATLELAKGNSAVENGEIQYAAEANDSSQVKFSKLKIRQFTQYEADLIYRFGSREQFYAGLKYNSVDGTQAFGLSTTATTAGGINQGIRKDVSINRAAVGAGWFITRNILVKGEYVSQMYKGFPDGNILEGGKFDGFILQGSIAF